jgi:hypothetical protein
LWYCQCHSLESHTVRNILLLSHSHSIVRVEIPSILFAYALPFRSQSADSATG